MDIWCTQPFFRLALYLMTISTILMIIISRLDDTSLIMNYNIIIMTISTIIIVIISIWHFIGQNHQLPNTLTAIKDSRVPIYNNTDHVKLKSNSSKSGKCLFYPKPELISTFRLVSTTAAGTISETDNQPETHSHLVWDILS